jgi:hypothetical protein
MPPSISSRHPDYARLRRHSTFQDHNREERCALSELARLGIATTSATSLTIRRQSRKAARASLCQGVRPARSGSIR